MKELSHDQTKVLQIIIHDFLGCDEAQVTAGFENSMRCEIKTRALADNHYDCAVIDGSFCPLDLPTDTIKLSPES